MTPKGSAPYGETAPPRQPPPGLLASSPSSPLPSIGVVLHVHALQRHVVLVRGRRVVLAPLGLGVGGGALQQLRLRLDLVLVLAGPGLQHQVLQGGRRRRTHAT